MFSGYLCARLPRPLSCESTAPPSPQPSALQMHPSLATRRPFSRASAQMATQELSVCNFPRLAPTPSRLDVGWARGIELPPGHVANAVTAKSRRSSQRLAARPNCWRWVGRCHRSCTCATFRHHTSRDTLRWLNHGGECSSALGDPVEHQATSRNRRRTEGTDSWAPARLLPTRHLGIWTCAVFRRTNPSFGCTRATVVPVPCLAGPAHRAGSGPPVGIWQATRRPIFLNPINPASQRGKRC
ncbi:hypothetical protein ABID26_005513 [Mesorhizobium shonense]|uniref:Uncharacterized protein n=1 Tax=Mesorhizobium shonense TaxID=1209948 RepID=A0ABV2HZM8_9HYPH